MSGTPSMLADLFAECDAQAVRLSLAADGGLAVDGPPAALSPDLLDRLRAHKHELLDALKTLRGPQGAEGVQPDPQAGPESASRYRVDPRPLTVDAEGWPLDLTDRDGRPLTVIDPPPADCECGRMVEPWRDVRGRWRCAACDPPAMARLFDLVARIRNERLRQGLPQVPTWPEPAGLLVRPDCPPPVKQPGCRCGGTTTRDVAIHTGQSVRRECDRCGQFLGFPVWYGLLIAGGPAR